MRERAGENLHMLMTMAYTLWQLLRAGYLKRLERKHRRVTWGKVAARKTSHHDSKLGRPPPAAAADLESLPNDEFA